ncbi:MAG: Phosphomannomutase [Candidatus Parcubacteria bacterium]|nr:Phosphomannomutase [Candidatus Parcubacteria bacterium]
MTLQDKQLVIFDLDGTLAPSKQAMGPELAALIPKLLARVKIAVISGGGFPQFESEFLRSFPPGNENFSNLFLLPTSGTRLMVWKGAWTEVYNERLPEQERKRLIAAFGEALKVGGYHEPPKIYGPLIEDRGSQITFSGLGQNAPLELKEAWDPKHEKREKIAKVLRLRLPEFDIRVGGTTSIDITRRGINKAYGIHKLEQHLNIPISNMIFVGDALFFGGNDYPAKTTGVDCIQVSGPEETTRLVSDWLK